MTSKRYFLKYFNLSFEFFFILLISVIAGYSIDYFFEIQFYVFTMTLPIVSFFYSLYKIYKNVDR